VTTAFTTLPFPDLLARFASKDPVPGGGSASALAGALAAALAAMVGGLTVGKAGYEAAFEEAEALARQAGALSARLVAAAEADAAAFEAVMQAMALPKATDDEKATRRAAMQRAFQGATTAPLGVARACLDAGALALRLVAIGNRNATSDAAVGVLLAVTGAEGSLFNVAINLGSIQDAGFAGTARAEADGMWAEAARLREALWGTAAEAGLPSPRQGVPA
jgi:formiminotetrahydrofolate cyclodeaminase